MKISLRRGHPGAMFAKSVTMLQTVEAAASIKPGDNPADRRAHPRIPSTRLPVTRVHIPARSAVSLVDLSAGGALLELPFQMAPESRFAVKLDTSIEQIEVPFQMLRCYVADLKNGITYHAAGAFDSLLDLQALAQRTSSVGRRLLESLERLQTVVQKAAAQSRSDAAFFEVLCAAITGLRRGESLDLVTLKVKAHLTQTFPTLSILPSAAIPRDQSTSVQAFGLTFLSRHTLSAQDRRLLKCNAQLLSMLEETRRDMRSERASDSPQIVYSAAEWLSTQQQQVHQLIATPRTSRPASRPAADESSWKAIESLILKAAVL